MTMTPDQSPSLLDFMEVPDVVAYAGEKREGLSELGSEPLIAAMKTVYDPEIPVDIYELGLIYRLEAKPDGDVEVDVTLVEELGDVTYVHASMPAGERIIARSDHARHRAETANRIRLDPSRFLLFGAAGQRFRPVGVA